MPVLRRLLVLPALVVGILVFGIGLWGMRVAASAQMPWRLTCMLFGAGLVYVAWRVDRKPSVSAGIYPLPDSTGTLDAPIHRTGAVLFAVLLVTILWLVGFALGMQLQWPYPGWIALVAGLPLAAWPFAGLLQAERYLRIDANGMDHYRLGRIPWTDIDGIRMSSITVKGQTKHSLVLHIAHPARYLDRFTWRNALGRLALQRRAEIRFPLQWTRTRPLEIFEAATRFRFAIQPPAMTGWEGDPEAMLTVSRWIAAQPVATVVKAELDSPLKVRYQRVSAVNAAMVGGWTSLDTPEMAELRLETVRLRDQVLDDQFARMQVELEKMLSSGVTPAAIDFDTINARARTDAETTSAGKNLQQMSSRLVTQTASRRRRQQLQASLTIGAIVLLWIVVKFVR